MSLGHTRIGRILRAHGTAGEVVIEPELEADVFHPDQVLYLHDPKADKIPYRIASVRKVTKGGNTQFFVFFGSVTTRNLAEALRGKPVFVPSSLVPEPEEDTDDWDITGYAVVDSDGTPIGTVLDVIENPAHPLLEVKDDAGRFFIPYVDAYVIDIDDDAETVTVQDVDALRTL
jgi:16S rRNA processing protein RimM